MSTVRTTGAQGVQARGEVMGLLGGRLRSGRGHGGSNVGGDGHAGSCI